MAAAGFLSQFVWSNRKENVLSASLNKHFLNNNERMEEIVLTSSTHLFTVTCCQTYSQGIQITREETRWCHFTDHMYFVFAAVLLGS